MLTTGVVSTYLLGACGRPQPGARPAAATTPVDDGSFAAGIDRPATVGVPAERVDPPNLLPRLEPTWQPGDFINHVAPGPLLPNGFSFTLDDGPSPYNTDPILRALEAYGLHATFFLIGVNVRSWPEIARRIRDAGHEIGNHSVYHTPYVASSLAAQIGPNQDIIEDATGVRPVANRTPGLTRGSILLSTCAAQGMYELHTDLVQNDWRSPRWSVGALVAEAQREYRAGAFALCHDGGGRRPTADAWRGLMDVALGKGLQPARATDHINTGTPRPGRMSYSYSLDPADDGVETASIGTPCNYDPKAELLRRLDDVSIKSAERSRIVEVLADIEATERDT